MPVWSEEADDFEDFVEECFWYRKGFKESERHLATARIVRGFRERNGTAWRLVKALRGGEVAKEVLEGRYGVEYLLQHLKQEMCPLTVPDVAKHMDAYFYRLKRNPGESIANYDIRDRELYGRMCRSLKRVITKELENDWVARHYKAKEADSWSNG